MVDKTKSVNDLFKVIFSNGFPRLRICTAVGFDTLRWNSAWTGSPTLRHLTFDFRGPFNYEQIGSLCRNLRRYNHPSQCSLGPQTSMMSCCAV